MLHHHSANSFARANRPTSALPRRDHAVTPRALGGIKRLVGGLEHFFRGALLRLTLGDTDTHGHRDARNTAASPALTTLLVVLGAIVLVAQLDMVVGDHFANDLQVRHAFLQALAGEHHRELFTAIAIGTTAAADLRQLAR